MEQPEERSGEWFNVLVLHQNRIDCGPKNFNPDEVLPDFLDFVLWGHKHYFHVESKENQSKKIWRLHPGSSVATFELDGEPFNKNNHNALLNICGNRFKCTPIKLQTHRSFVKETKPIIDNLEHFPAEVLVEIFIRTDGVTLLNLSDTCMLFAAIAPIAFEICRHLFYN